MSKVSVGGVALIIVGLGIGQLGALVGGALYPVSTILMLVAVTLGTAIVVRERRD